MSSAAADGGVAGTPASILVVGSINMDLVVRCPHIPAPGETVLAWDFARSPGGKGANGATAAARLSRGSLVETIAVTMLGAIGRDETGVALRRNLQEHGVGVDHVLEIDGVPTAIALVAVADSGENSIIVVSGANGRVRPEHVERVLPALRPSAVMLQLETPLDTVRRAAELGREHGVRVLLDPAPAPSALPEVLFRHVDVLLPNEGELAALTGLPTESQEECARAAEALRLRGVGVVVVKRGDRGTLVVDKDGARPIPTLPVTVVDTTGAGDCFNGAITVALVEGQSIDAAARFATHAAALACTRLGAQTAQPTRAEVEAVLDQ